jgi:hypothetical protein
MATSTYRKIRHKASRTVLRAPIVWLRNRGLDGNDVCLASYPRSGSTWTRFMLARLLTGKSAGFDSINRLIPEIGIHHGAAELLPGGGRLIKTHELYSPCYKRAIYIIRDVRDVVLSQYSREKGLGLVWWGELDAYIPMFLDGSINNFGPWQDHVPNWLDSPLGRRGDLLMVQFEEMRRNPQPVLERVVDFLGFQVSSDNIAEAIADNTVERMRAREKQAVTMRASSGEEGRFVRQGAVMGWREKMTESQLQMIEKYAGKTMARLGYPSWRSVALQSGELTATGA